jgi:hypothetical protein
MLEIVRARKIGSVPLGTDTPSEASPCADCEQRWSEELNFSTNMEEVIKHYMNCQECTKEKRNSHAMIMDALPPVFE